MDKLSLNQIPYYQLIDRINSQDYVINPYAGSMSIHQTINFLVYNVQIILGEVNYSYRAPLLTRLLRKKVAVLWKTAEHLRNQHLEKYFTRIKYFNEDFSTDKSLLVVKLKKLILLPYSVKCINHPVYGNLSSPQASLLMMRMIDFYLTPFTTCSQLEAAEEIYL